MPTLLIAAASALLLAALVTETASRFWPGNYLALMVITFVALVVNGLFNARLKQNVATEVKTTTDRKPRRDKPQSGKQGDADKQRSGGNQRSKSNRRERENTSPDKAVSTPSSSRDTPAPVEGPQETGTVKWFNRSKGYGFIIRENGEEIFVHQRSIVTQGERNQRPVLHDGQKVSFVVAHLEKGAQAEQVSGLE